MHTKGKISSWNDEKGYGFIAPNDGGEKVFVHIKAFRNRSRRPENGQLVTYALSADNQGRPCAIQVTLSGDCIQKVARHTGDSLSIVAAILFIVIVGASVLVSRIPHQVLVLYLVASLLTYIMYALDKTAAKSGGWRTPESTLHLLSLIGGWPGALIAQQKLRHKSKKQSFRSLFWVTVLVNCGAFAWLFTPTGIATVQSLIERMV